MENWVGTENDREMDSEGQDMSNNLDPMKIEGVLETIFEFCPASDLKNCRLVCKKWKDVSLKVWRNTAALSLYGDQADDSNGRISVKGYLQMLDNKDDDPHKLRAFPFKRFRIKDEIGFYLRRDVTPITRVASKVALFKIDRTLSDYSSFLRKFQSLEALELNYCDLSHVSRLKEKTYPEFPNLKGLKIHQNDKASNYSASCSLKGLLFCFPKLESLCLEYNHRKVESWEYVEDIVKIMRIMRKQMGESVVPLKELEIIDTSKSKKGICRADNAFLKEITKCKLPLQRLSIDVVWKIREKRVVDSLCQVLRSCRNTLQYLKIAFNFSFHILDDATSDTLNSDSSPWRPDSDPFSMKQLKEIIFTNGNPWGLHLLAHLELPKLEKLIFPIDKNRMELKAKVFRISFAEGAVFEKLEMFDFFENCKIPGPKMVNTLVSMMPQLVRLTMPMDQTTFRIICEHLKGLKTLNVLAATCHYAELDDETITGIPTRRGVQEPRRPNITDLTLLSEVKISCEAQLQRRDVKFTDHSVVHGFLQLPRLFNLSIAFKELSHVVKAKLLNHVKGNVEIQTLGKRRFPSEYSPVHLDRRYKKRSKRDIDSDSEPDHDDSESDDHEYESDSDGPAYSGDSWSSRSVESDLYDSYSDISDSDKH